MGGAEGRITNLLSPCRKKGLGSPVYQIKASPGVPFTARVQGSKDFRTCACVILHYPGVWSG